MKAFAWLTQHEAETRSLPAIIREQLPPADRPFYQDHLAHVLLRLQSKDGSWWDYPLYNYHQQYGTAFALMTLKCCRRPAVASR